MKRSMMQVYVKGSDKAFELYQKAFDAELGAQYKNDDGSYMHAELNAYGQILAISEADEAITAGSTMQFCFHFGEGEDEKVKKAYEVLKDGAEITHPLGPCSFSPLMSALIDKFGVSWCIFV